MDNRLGKFDLSSAADHPNHICSFIVNGAMYA